MLQRLISIPFVLVVLPLWLVTLPLWLPLTAMADVATRAWRFPTVRLGLGAGVYLVHDTIGIAASAWLWLTGGFGRRLDLDAHRALQSWWASSLLDWAGRLLGVRVAPVDLDGIPDETFVLLSRHASMADAILPAVLMTRRGSRFVHYVLKKELRWDPALDVVGTRLGNHFVARDGDTDTEAAGIARLAAEARPGSVLVIFPEGTYASPQARRRVVASLRRRGADVAATRADKLRHLLPPRPAGTLAMLRSQPEAGVVIVGHVGLEGVAEIRGLRRRLPLSEPVEIAWWHHPRADLPTDDDGLTAWLNDRWDELDQWISDRLEERTKPAPAKSSGLEIPARPADREESFPPEDLA